MLATVNKKERLQRELREPVLVGGSARNAVPAAKSSRREGGERGCGHWPSTSSRAFLEAVDRRAP